MAERRKETEGEEVERKGDMSVREAGRKGGETTAQRHGREFYEEIGRKGGEAVSKDREHMSDIGQKGGQTVRRLVEEGKRAEGESGGSAKK